MVTTLTNALVGTKQIVQAKRVNNCPLFIAIATQFNNENIMSRVVFKLKREVSKCSLQTTVRDNQISIFNSTTIMRSTELNVCLVSIPVRQVAPLEQELARPWSRQWNVKSLGEVLD